MTKEQHLIAALKRRDSDASAVVFEHYSNRICRQGLACCKTFYKQTESNKKTFLALIQTIDRFHFLKACSADHGTNRNNNRID